MKILTINSPPFQFGYFSDKEYPSHKFLCLVFFSCFWNKQTGRWGFGFGIPFLYAVGIAF